MITSEVNAIERTELAPWLNVPRILVGLWQGADMERGGRPLDAERTADALQAYADAGFDAFDMADHYGSAELIAARLLARRRGAARAFTKWCPAPGAMPAEVVRAGVERSRQRLGVDCIDLLQLHWWQYTHPGYLDALHEMAALRESGRIAHIGLTNFDTDHLRLVLRDGVPVATNQVAFSLLDRRAAGRLSRLCQDSGVKLLAYGTHGGGYLS
jgi:aryl-alcohol dehydrogenase-like predicted oxidoreductase